MTTHLLLLLITAATAAGTSYTLTRPPGPAGDDNGTSDCRSYGAVTRREVRR